MRHKRAVGAAWLFASAALGGCANLGGTGSTAPPPPPPQAEGQSKAGSVEPLLEMMTSLPQGDPAHQAEMFERRI